MTLNAAFFLCYVHALRDTCNNSALDDLKCRPEWFDEQISALSHVEKQLATLASFTLTFYLSHAYARYNAFYWECRALQGAINNIAMIVGSAAAAPGTLSPEKEAESVRFSQNFERYLTLCHVLCHMGFSPLLKQVKMETIVKEEVLGITLCTAEEAEIIGVLKNGPNAVLSWISLLFDRGCQSGIFAHDGNNGNHRLLSLQLSFTANLEALRGSVAKIGFQDQLPIPIAYANIMQIFIDTVCLLSPFTLVYDINTVIVSAAGFNEINIWNTLPFTLFAAFVFTFFYQGLLALAKILCQPFGSVLKPNGQLSNSRFFIDVRTIIFQTRTGTHLWFNAKKHLPPSVRVDPAIEQAAIEQARARDREAKAAAAKQPPPPPQYPPGMLQG